MPMIHASTALTPDGWRDDLRVEISGGRIVALAQGAAQPGDERVDALVPAPVNLHSHTFQRAMAGLTERRSAGQDSFWTWRTLMYRFLDQLSPEDVQAVAAMAMVEMAEAGFAAVAEFHYLHHAPGGAAYADRAEMAGRIVAAAGEVGLGLTLLPVLYEQGGCDGRALAAGQLRFGNDPDGFAALWQGAAAHGAGLGPDARIGVAPHSLRAVSRDSLAWVAGLAPEAPVHIHVAEQLAEVAEVEAAYGARPVRWLLDNHAVDGRWCLIHATQMDPDETLALAASGAVAGLCPITEANLGDGIFDGARFHAAGGRFGVGSDSNVRIDLAEELRLYEYSQRLQLKGRAILAGEGVSVGRTLWQGAAAGGAQAAGRAAGAITPGLWADLLALDLTGADFEGRRGDLILDTFLFARPEGRIRQLWSAGRPLLQAGRHPARPAIEARFAAVMRRLRGAL